MRYLLLILTTVGCSKTPEEFLTEADLYAIPHIINIDEVDSWSPKVQIIHIADLHYVDQEDFKATAGEDWEQFLKDVAAIQAQQIEVLRHLRDNHGIHTVYQQQMTDAESPLALGAAAQVDGLTILPADDEEGLEAAIETREDAIVKNLLASGEPVVVVILGGDHNLGNNVPKGVEVVRLQVKEHFFAADWMAE